MPGDKWHYGAAMIRLRSTFAIASAFLLGSHFSHAQEAEKKAAPNDDDLHSIRLLVERQSVQIEALDEEVKRLAHLIETGQPGTAAQPTPPAPAAPQETVPVATAVAVATPGDTASTHTVTKGETLTSIAKHYKTNVADLMKSNKIENDRKLQIGQTLIIPSAKPSESTQEKKENQ
jgi:LysM repeat protein